MVGRLVVFVNWTLRVWFWLRDMVLRLKSSLRMGRFFLSLGLASRAIRVFFAKKFEPRVFVFTGLYSRVLSASGALVMA